MVKTILRYIDARTGRYVKVEYAKKHPGTTVGMKVKIGLNKQHK